MKHFLHILLCILLLLSFTGCGTRPTPTVPEKAPVQDTPKQEQPPAEAPPQTQPEEEEPTASEEEPTVPEDAQRPVTGIWSTEEGQQTDPVLEYQNCYVCIFENGTAMRYGPRQLELGSWHIPETGEIHVRYSHVLTDIPGEGWRETDTEAEAVYSHDPETNTLTQLSSQPESLFSANSIHVPAHREDACRKAMEKLEAYGAYGHENWMSQTDLNLGSGTLAALYEGLEACLHTMAMEQLPQEAEALSQQEVIWQAAKLLRLEAVQKEYEGGSIAPLMVNEENIAYTASRIEALLFILFAA